LAKDAKKLGFKFLLDYHYADGWADPGKQPSRKLAGQTHKELVQAVFEYTRDTIAAFRDAGVLPDMVQIGNEITNGMLWPTASCRTIGTTSRSSYMRASMAWMPAGETALARKSWFTLIAAAISREQNGFSIS